MNAPPSPRSRALALLGAAGRAVGVLIGLIVGRFVYDSGLLPTVLALVLAGGVFWGLLVRLLAWRQGWPRPRLFGPRASANARRLRLQAWSRVLFWLAAGLSLILTIPHALLAPGEYREAVLVLSGFLVVNVAMAVLPAVPTVRRWPNVLALAGWVLLGVEWVRLLVGPPAPAVTIRPPFEGTWSVVQGGRSVLVNHHYPITGQSHALDLVRLEDGLATRGDPHALGRYVAFGAPLRAPADGTIERAVDGHPDMAIGQTDTDSLIGNHVVIAIAPRRYVLLAHLQEGSVTVAEGQAVRAGDLIGRCGNSGNTSQPHLHLQVQSHPDFRADALRTFPIAFSGDTLYRGGRLVRGAPRRAGSTVDDSPGDPGNPTR